MTINYVYRGKIMRVEQRDRLVRGWKDANGDTKYEYEDLGWFLSLDSFPLIAFPLGKEKPEPLPQVGSVVELVLRFPPEPRAIANEAALRPVSGGNATVVAG